MRKIIDVYIHVLTGQTQRTQGLSGVVVDGAQQALADIVRERLDLTILRHNLGAQTQHNLARTLGVKAASAVRCMSKTSSIVR